MAQPIIFKITQAGLAAALAASDELAQVKLNLTQVAIGSGKYTPTGNETALQTEISRSAIISGGAELASKTLRFSSNMTASTATDVFEVGLMTEDGALFAVASSTTEPLFSLQPDITFVASFGLSLAEIDASVVNVVTDPNGAMSVALMQQHLAAPDPHPQYASRTLVDTKVGEIEQWQANHIANPDPHSQYLNASRFQLLLQTLIPMGYLHHTHEAANPKPLFDELMGIDTAWRRITGKIMLASDPNDPFIRTHSLVLGQRGVTTAAEANRPHVYPVQTTNIFERYDPSAPIETVWNVASNKVAIGEGEAVRFTITVNNLPDGQILDWTVKEGELNPTNDDITTPEKTESGTVVIRSGQAIIDFTTTPDNNEVDPQKYVRLTVGAPANLSINVPIADAGHNETVVHISQSTNDGIVLDEYYKAQFGAYPTATDNIRFIVDNGVNIVAPDTQTPAIQDGVNWPEGSQKTVENRGRILGRGGNGGKSAVYTIDGLSDFRQSAVAGEDGGVAIEGSLSVDNFGVIAGGGGGGGGNAAIVLPSGSPEFALNGAGSGGGGAPFGTSYLNRTVFESVAQEVATVEYLPLLMAARDSAASQLQSSDFLERVRLRRSANWFYNSYGSSFYNYENPSIDLKPLAIALGVRTDGVSLRHEVPKSKLSTTGIRATQSEINQANSYATVSTFEGNDAFFTPLQFHPSSAQMLKGASGGIGFDNNQRGAFFLRSDKSGKALDYRSLVKGADGGDIGENGENGSVVNTVLINTVSKACRVVAETNLPQGYLQVPPAAGGLAGFIKEGNVTIRNLGNGVTKGR